MEKRILGTVFLVLSIAIVTAVGTTFAFYAATVPSNSTIGGQVMEFNVALTPSTIYKATKLVPLSDSLVDDSIKKSSGKCVDSKGYEVCSLYRLTLTNSGDAQVMNGYISTVSSTYTTDNLKMQLFDSSYNPVSDIITIPRAANGKEYFKKNGAMVSTNVGSSSVVYYLAIWLQDTGGLQNEDYSKSFSGNVVFESIYGDEIKASFTS